MTVGLKNKEGTVLMFTSVTSLSVGLSSNVANHPVERGVSITDHSVNNPDTISLSGLFTSVDFMSAGVESFFFLSESPEGTPLTYTGAAAVPADSVTISSNKENSKLSKFIPAGLQNLIKNELPSVEVTPSPNPASLEGIRLLLTSWKESAEVISVLLFDEGLLKDVKKDCLIASINFDESVEDGDALYVQMSLTPVRFVVLGSTRIKQQTWKEIDMSAKRDNNKGQQQGVGQNTPSSEVNNKPPAGEAEINECMTEQGELVNVMGVGPGCLLVKGMKELF